MNEKDLRFEKINFTINILFIISISLFLINLYAGIALLLGIIYLLLSFWIKSKPFYSSLEWPGFKMSTITSLIISVLSVAYVLFISREHINN